MLKTRSIVSPLLALASWPRTCSLTVSVMPCSLVPASMRSWSLLDQCCWCHRHCTGTVGRPEVWRPVRRFPTTYRAVCGQPAWRAEVRSSRLDSSMSGELLGAVLAQARRSRSRSPRRTRTACRPRRSGGRPPRRARAAARGWPCRSRGRGTRPGPEPRSVSSTSWPRRARSSSVSGRPLQALRTPAIALSRSNASLAPERFTTVSCISSRVVNRCSHSPAARAGGGSSRRPRRPGSRGPWCRCVRQNGQCIVGPPLGSGIVGALQRPVVGCLGCG